MDRDYREALKQLIANLRRDLERPDKNIVIARIGDYAFDLFEPQAGSRNEVNVAARWPREPLTNPRRQQSNWISGRSKYN